MAQVDDKVKENGETTSTSKKINEKRTELWNQLDGIVDILLESIQLVRPINFDEALALNLN